MGKGSVQVVRELDFGGAVRYTAAYYLTPQGEPIDNVGIVPQVGVGKRRGGGWSGLPAGHRHRHRPLAHSGGLGSAAQRARAPSRLVREGR